MPSISLADFQRLINTPKEHECLEFKRATTSYDSTKLYKYCVGIANEGGGKLILGVTDKPPRQVVGTASINDPADMQSKIFDKLGFRVNIEELVHPNGRVIICHIPSRPRGTAYDFEGAYLMRSSESLVPMSEDRLREIFAEGGSDWLNRPAREDCSSDDIVQLLDTRSYFDLTKQPIPRDQAGEIARFEGEGLIAEDYGRYTITNLGAILFAKRLDDFEELRRKAPRFIVYDGTDKRKVQKDIIGNKGYVVGFQGLLESISAQIPSNEFIGKAFRTELLKMFPDEAIRELVANALVHQEFTAVGNSVSIELYTDRIEISNPGKPPISTDRFIDEDRARNERLANLMRRVGICEQRGSGIDKVVFKAEFYQLPAPDFRVSDHRTIAVMFAYKPFDAMDGKDRVRSCYQHCVLKYVTNERMTNQTLRERFQLPKSKRETVSRIIADAIQQNRIKADDPSNKSKRYTKYVPWFA